MVPQVMLEMMGILATPVLLDSKEPPDILVCMEI